MQRFPIAAAAAAALLLPLALAGAAGASDKSLGNGDAHVKDVRVVNTESEPVPVKIEGTTAVSGDVQVTNKPTVKAEQSGPWNVGLDSAANTVRSADERGRQPYQETFNIMTNTDRWASAEVLVPAGKRLVVEYLSGYVLASGPAVISLQPTVGGYHPGVWVAVDKVRMADVPGGLHNYFGGELVRYYGEPGATITAAVYVDAAVQFNAYVNVIGYLVDVP